jgi:hypothetical protein
MDSQTRENLFDLGSDGSRILVGAQFQREAGR